MTTTFEIRTLGEVCEFSYGDSLPERRRLLGPIPVYGSNGVVGYHSESLTSGETIVIGRKGSIGEVHYSPGPCFPIDTTYYVAETRCACHLKWLYYTLRSLRLTDLNKFSAVPGLNRNDAYEKRIVFPPLPIQKRIAAILEKADAAREKRRQANELTEQFLQSAFLEMFGDPVTNPKGWARTTIAEIVAGGRHSIVRGPFGGAIKKEIFVPDGYKIYEQKNAIKDDFEIGTYFIDEKKYLEMKSFAIRPYDVIISCSGTIGKVAIVPRSAKPGIINQALLKLTLEPKRALPIFVKFMLETDHVQRLMFGSAGGSAIKNVKPLKEIRQKSFPLPPLAEQQKFAALVEKVERLRAKQRKSEKELENLFNSLMQKAFRGELVA